MDLKALKDRIEECFKRAEEFFGEKIPRMKLRLDLKGTTAGQANYGKKFLRFNTKLADANEEDFLATTVPHEVAHIVCRWKHGYAGIDSHGREWKKIMVEIFHIPPKRCHNYDVSKVKRKTKEYVYTCDCVGKLHMMGIIKHNKLKRGQRVSQCLKCGAHLKFSVKGSAGAMKNRGLKDIELD